jgi:cadmium resistance transport/sequestration family protein
VTELLGTIFAAASVFAGTNIDDLIVLTVLFLSWRAGSKPRQWHIWAGQYTGIGALVAVSAIAALGLTVLPDQWVGLLGLIPFALGVRGLVGAIHAQAESQEPSITVATGLLSVAGVTIANGADNVSVYTPMFRTIGLTNSIITVAVFAVLVAVWCLAGSRLGSHKKITDIVEKYGHWIVPAVFMLIGVSIVVECGVIGRIANLF